MRRHGIGFVLAALLSMFLVLAAQAQTDTSGGTSSTVPTLTIASSSATATEGDEVTYTVTASSAPSSALPVVVQVRAHGEVMDTRTVAEVFLPAGATTVTLRLQEFPDEIAESSVSVTLTLAAGSGYSVGEASEATVTISYPSHADTQATPTPTPTPAVSPPAAPAGVSISSPSINSFTVSWTTETGKSYRVEREAAYLFKYRVWQVVADDLTTGTHTESNLPCGLYYLFQVRAKVTGSAYGPGSAALGFPRSCTSSTDSGARGAGSVRALNQDPPQLRLVTDNPTQTSIQIRLLLHGPSHNPGQFTPIPPGLDRFRVDRSDRGTMNFSGQRKEGPQSEFHWEGLECGSGYYFRAQAYGDGLIYQDGGDVYSFNEIWGPWSDEPPRGLVGGTTRGCPKLATPEVDVIPMTHRLFNDRWVELRWKPIIGADDYVVDIWDTLANGGNGGWRKNEFVIGDNGVELSVLVNLDTTSPYDNRGLFHQPAGFTFRVQATSFSDPNRNSGFSQVTIVDSPIVSANGDTGDFPVMNLWGKIEVNWNPAGHGDDDTVEYTLRWRKLSNKQISSRDHTKRGWFPEPWKSLDTDSEYDWKSITTTDTQHTIGGPRIGRSEIDREEVYALQLNYTLNGKRYYSGREAFAWSSNSGAGGGERVATYPVKDPLSDKTYAYRICEDGFPAAHLEDWKKLIKHALEQWEVATGLVTMTYVGATCANYTEAMADIAREFNVASGRVLTVAELEYVRSYLSTLDYLTSVQTDDEEFNEIIMVNNVAGPYAQFKRAGIFPEFSEDLGIGSCVLFEKPTACANPWRGEIADITLPKSVFGIGPVNVPGGDEIVDESDVRFNTCPAGADFIAYRAMIHEAGHVLGIRGGERDEDWAEITIHHPTIAYSVMSPRGIDLKVRGTLLKLPHMSDCSPNPLDIMAIYAIYQSR